MTLALLNGANVLAFQVYHYDRSLTRYQLQQRAPYLPRVGSISLLDRSAGKARLQALLAALDKLDFQFVGAKLLARARISEAEAEILRLLSEATADELNYMLTNIQLPLLLYKGSSFLSV